MESKFSRRAFITASAAAAMVPAEAIAKPVPNTQGAAEIVESPLVKALRANFDSIRNMGPGFRSSLVLELPNISLDGYKRVDVTFPIYGAVR